MRNAYYFLVQIQVPRLRRKPLVALIPEMNGDKNNFWILTHNTMAKTCWFRWKKWETMSAHRMNLIINRYLKNIISDRPAQHGVGFGGRGCSVRGWPSLTSARTLCRTGLSTQSLSLGLLDSTRKCCQSCWCEGNDAACTSPQPQQSVTTIWINHKTQS